MGSRSPMSGSEASPAVEPVSFAAWYNFGFFLLQRLLWAVGTLLAATFGAFVALRLAPGDALTILGAGRHLDPALEAAWRLRYGLDQPLVVQYLLYLRNLLVGDFGISHTYGRPVAEFLTPALHMTIQWQIPALLISILGALVLGIATAAREKEWFDSLATWLFLTGISLPEFVVALPLVWLLALTFPVLPVAGTSTPLHFVLPAITIAIPMGATLSQVLGSEIAEVMQQPYVLAARAKGLSGLRLVMIHVLPNALQPFLPVVGFQVGRCVAGAFLIETIYNIPGVGRLAVMAVMQRDYPVVLAVTTLMAVAFVVANLLAELLARAIDPRITCTATGKGEPQ